MPKPGGAPSPYYYTGSPGDAHSCASCHGSAGTVSGWLTSNIPAGGYVPGTTYQITATNSISGSGAYGFEVSPQTLTGTLVGTLAAGTNSKLVGSGKWVTHSTSSTGVTSWIFNWTAPVAGTGDVTFYGSFARSTGSATKVTTLTVSEQAGGSLPATAGPITGPAAVCTNNSYSYSVATITGATSYVWSVPAGVDITSGQGTMNMTANFTAAAVAGSISVYGSNTNGNGLPSNLAVTVNSSPSQPSAISGQASPCQNSSQVYTVSNVSGITYAWTVPAGSAITAGQGSNSITMTVGPNNGTITVVPSNSCGTGTSSTLAISTSGVAPAQPSAITGQLTPCQGSSEVYSVTSVPGITYAWTVPSGSTITAGQGSGSITVSIGPNSGSVQVLPSNLCGNGPASSLSLAPVPSPSQPSSINGQAFTCQGSSQVYSVTNVAGITYAWTVPTGSVITAGQGSNSVTVTIGSNNGNIAVVPSNLCGSGTPSSLAITASSAPSQPSAVNGTASPCQGSSQAYSVTNVSGVTYAWSVPAGSSIISGQGSSSILVTIGSTNGNIEVAPSNLCGNGNSSSLALSVGAIPGIAATPSGPDQVDLANTASSNYSTTGTPLASSYTWDLNPVNAGTISGSGLTVTVNWGNFLGTVSIRVKALNSCGEGSWSAVKQTQLIKTTGIPEGTTSGIRVYPSPSNGQFNIDVQGSAGAAAFRIYSPAGTELQSGSLPGNGITSIETQLPAGLYILAVEVNGRISNQKLLIRK